jgi:hypothetical protein
MNYCSVIFLGEQKKIEKRAQIAQCSFRELNPVIPKQELAAPARRQLRSVTAALTVVLHFAGRTV